MKKVIVVLSAIAFVSFIGCDIAFAREKPKETTKEKTSTSTVDTSCVKAAVEKREKAMQTALESFTKSVNSALKDREKALSDAWDMSDATKRKAAIKKAWETFTTTSKTAKKTFNSAGKSAWATYKNDTKKCKGANTSEESSNKDISF
jgi:hypothetical protein